MLHVVWIHGQVQIQRVSQELVRLISAFPATKKENNFKANSSTPVPSTLIYRDSHKKWCYNDRRAHSIRVTPALIVTRHIQQPDQEEKHNWPLGSTLPPHWYSTWSNNPNTENSLFKPFSFEICFCSPSLIPPKATLSVWDFFLWLLGKVIIGDIRK